MKIFLGIMSRTPFWIHDRPFCHRQVPCPQQGDAYRLNALRMRNAMVHLLTHFLKSVQSKQYFMSFQSKANVHVLDRCIGTHLLILKRMQ